MERCKSLDAPAPWKPPSDSESGSSPFSSSSSTIPSPVSHNRKSNLSLDRKWEATGRARGVLPGDYGHQRKRRNGNGWVIGGLCLFCLGYTILRNGPAQRWAGAVKHRFWDTRYEDTWVNTGYMAGMRSLPDDPNHILVPQTRHPPPSLLRPIHNRPPASHLVEYYTTGTIADPPLFANHPQSKTDIVFLWVNASDPYFQQDALVRGAQEGVYVDMGDGKRYRDNGELRGALRSVKSSLRGLGTIHVLSGDYHVRRGTDDRNVEQTLFDNGTCKMGQIPHWLDWGHVKSPTGQVKWHFHSNVFRLPMDENDAEADRILDIEDEEEWREISAPSYNSFGIETRIGWIEGLAENFILANDDMFMLDEMTTADFHHALLGDVIRVDGALLVRPEMTSELVSTSGEWGGLQHAAQMISRRFPSFARGYMYHIPKALTLSLTHEASVIWEDELAEAATRGFRRSERGIGDIEMSWLVGFLRVERWREALLWTWAVARMGGESGYWGVEQKEELKRLLHVTDVNGDFVMVEKGERKTLEDISAISNRMGWDMPRQTEYRFSSMDGVMLDKPGEPEETCFFSLRTCLPADFFTTTRPINAEGMFARLAFAHPDCGNCLIKALISASGPRGLSAILPHERQTFQPEHREPSRWERSEPMLPLTDVWQSANFSLHSVVRSGQDQWEGAEKLPGGRISLRQWTVKLLSRYAYVVGSTPWKFALIGNLPDLEGSLASLEGEDKFALACFNDDQDEDGDGKVATRFTQWMKDKWGDVDAPWER